MKFWAARLVAMAGEAAHETRRLLRGQDPSSPLLYEVARGETITITKRGGPVAILKPASEESGVQVRQAVEGLRASYDASYVALAARHGMALATADARLRAACEQSRVEVLA